MSFFSAASVILIGRNTAKILTETFEERDLVAQAAAGDQGAFTTLVKEYRRYVYGIAYRVIMDADAALDVTQNVFIKLAKSIKQYKGSGPFKAWLATIATREAISYTRGKVRRESPTEPEDLDRLAETQGTGNIPDARETLDSQRRLERIETAVAELPAQQRAILALNLNEDLGPKEISERLGISARQVRSQLHRAIARVKEKMSRNERKDK